MSTDVRSVSDDDVIEMVGVSGDFDRELPSAARQFSSDETGVSYLLSLLEERRHGGDVLQSCHRERLTRKVLRVKGAAGRARRRWCRGGRGGTGSRGDLTTGRCRAR